MRSGWSKWPVAAAALSLALAGCGNSAPAGTKVLVALPLKVRAAGLRALADATADPGHAGFRRFRTIAQIAATFGAPRSTIEADRRVLAGDGLNLTLDATHGAFWGSVTAAEVRRYFGTTLVNESGTIKPAGTPRVPHGLAGVTGVVGLDASRSLSTAVAGGTAAPACPLNPPSRAVVANVFGFERLTSSGATGTGTRIDILAIHRFEPAVFRNFDRCTGSSLSASSIAESAVPDTPSSGGGPEVALDSLVLMLLAPRTKLHVLRFDPSTPLAFPLMDLLSRGRSPDVLDITVTYCESELTSAERSLSEWLLAALAASGTSTAVAAGDTGSSGCYPTRSPAVTYPASSRFVVGIGGASYRGSADTPRQLGVWNRPGSAGGGGGTSKIVAAPPWQASGRREVPDISADAVPGTVGSIPVCATASDCAWRVVGGTSVGATVLGAAGLLLEQLFESHGSPRPWGNVAGAIWRRAKSSRAIADISGGANTTFTNACCKARVGYDTASGWGLLQPDRLSKVLARVRHGP